MVKFLHLRHKDENGRPKTRGGMTIAYVDEGQGVIHFAAAFCSKNDNYCRSVGRTKAAGRLNSDQYRYTVNDDKTGKTEERLVRSLVQNKLWK